MTHTYTYTHTHDTHRDNEGYLQVAIACTKKEVMTDWNMIFAAVDSEIQKLGSNEFSGDYIQRFLKVRSREQYVAWRCDGEKQRQTRDKSSREKERECVYVYVCVCVYVCMCVRACVHLYACVRACVSE
jgi:CO dehydrogenase/acetyl-CoA synthase alpha subunit